MLQQQHLRCIFKLNMLLQQPNSALFTAERAREKVKLLLWNH